MRFDDPRKCLATSTRLVQMRTWAPENLLQRQGSSLNVYSVVHSSNIVAHYWSDHAWDEAMEPTLERESLGF